MLRNSFSLINSTLHATGAERGMRLRPHKRWDDDGVASTVGTIMAMMVFLAFLSMFTSQYVPIWMEENEARHMSEAYGQFAALKQAVDMQILAGTIQGTSPVQMFSPVKLGADGIPMFAAPTAGYLSVHRGDSRCDVKLSFDTVTGTLLNQTVTGHNVSWNTGGTISLYVPNRYFTPQKLAYEGDSIILKQPDGEYMKAMPQFRMTRAGTTVNGTPTYHISYIMLDLRGPDTNYIGFGTRGVQTTLRSVTTTTFTNLTGNLTHTPLDITHSTWYGRAWKSSFGQSLENALVPPQYFNISVDKVLPMRDPVDDFWKVNLRIDPSVVASFTLTVAYIEISTAELGAA